MIMQPQCNLSPSISVWGCLPSLTAYLSRRRALHQLLLLHQSKVVNKCFIFRLIWMILRSHIIQIEYHITLRGNLK